MDITILAALNSITEYQAAPTEKTIYHCTQLIDDLSWNNESFIEYKSSDMQLWLHGDSAYLLAAKSRSPISGYFFLSDTLLKTLEFLRRMAPLAGASMLKTSLLINGLTCLLGKAI